MSPYFFYHPWIGPNVQSTIGNRRLGGRELPRFDLLAMCVSLAIYGQLRTRRSSE
jgi:hypothetical protein